MQNIITSPIFYQGCKKKNIKEGLIDYFPKNINRFIDLFCGSGIVSMNADANSYVLNDIEPNVINLLKMFKEEKPEKLIKNIEDKINKYELQYNGISFDTRSKTFNKELSDLHKNNYINFRNNYNINKNVLDLYILTIFCFSHQMRFNKDNNFNMPCGNGTFNNDNKKWIKESKEFFNKNTLLTNEDFRNIKIDKLKNNDFVYIDPPYLISTASYNENGGWTEKDEQDLYNLCNRLTDNSIKWAMSNVLECKGKSNTMLYDFIKTNNYNIHDFNLKYSCMGKGNSQNREVLITNY